MEKVIITRPMVGICHMQICAESNATDEEILSVCNLENPSGTSNGWNEVIRNDEKYPQMNPIQCADYKDRLHFMIAC